MIGQTAGEPIQVNKTAVKDGLTVPGPAFTLISAVPQKPICR